ncbi:MAG: acyl-CoA dehydrogenase family protein, partial [Alphaproteobacteria bacterium]|nr:acyl-CoA dehydrogenase family protein [Alphaproteobacteria bacterium]
MDFNFTADQLAFQEAARTFAQAELPAIAETCETDATPPPPALLKQYAQMGFLGVNIPTAYGGLGLGNLEALLILEEFAKISSAVAFPVFESCVGPVKAIEHFGSESIKKHVLPAICKGEMVVAIAMSEPNAGSALTDLQTKAQVKNGKVILNGIKRWCSGGGHADGYLVYCRMSEQAGAKGIGAVFVEKDTSGLSFGAQENLMGFRGVPSCDIFFDNAEIGEENIIMPAGGFKKLMEAFDLERCGNATMALGQASGALDIVANYVQERKQFGKPIIEFQAVQLRLAEMKMKIEAARLLIHRAAHNAEQGLPSMLDSSVAKCFANEIARDVTGAAIQLMGAYGYSKEFGIERRMRDAWGWGIAGGAIDIQKVNIA